jgi:hypothetical protein
MGRPCFTFYLRPQISKPSRTIRPIARATLTLAESQYALGALAMLGDGRKEAVHVLRSLLRKVRPTLLPRVGR